MGGVEDVMGIEPSIAPIENADELIKPYIINDVFRKEILSEKKFDMVSLFQTIEHIPNTEAMLEDVYDILNENGYFYLVCHDYKSFVNKFLGTRSPIYDIEHLQLFSKRSIYRILQKKGFRNIRIFTLWNEYPIKYWVKLFPFNSSVKKKLIQKLSVTNFGKLRLAINVGNIGAIASK